MVLARPVIYNMGNDKRGAGLVEEPWSGSYQGTKTGCLRAQR